MSETATIPAIVPKPPTKLNEQQNIVHNIVANHLQRHLNGENPGQVLMIVHGPGGTGKSTLLNAISETFSSMGLPKALALTAMSGVAASLIGGQTLHTWAALPVKPPKSDKWLTHPGKGIGERRHKIIDDALWVAIDEKSMLTTPLLYYLSQVTSFVKGTRNQADATVPFGGLNIILLGDFHQFPPVASYRKELYNSRPPNALCEIGRNLYEQFNVVIKLKEQMRISDLTWTGILQRARTGECTKDDILEIRKLVLSDGACNLPDFRFAPWDNVILVTTRNAVKHFWNEKMLQRHCQKAGQTRYILNAQDSVDDKDLTREQKYAIAHLKLEETNRLPHKVELARGMKAMVVMNLATDADLANGSRGTVEDIILDPRECGQGKDHEVVRLTLPPLVILFRPLSKQKISIPGLAEGIVPIFPSRTTFTIGSEKKITVQRRQFALTPAYAFTDFKSQGQTIECVIVDIAKPPTGTLTGFNAYVALSRSRGRNTIRLLRDFDEKLFTVHPSEELRKEEARLTELENATLTRYKEGDLMACRTGVYRHGG